MPKISNIRHLGKHHVMDIQVNSPNHIFYGNGIATSNSHAITYSTISYQTAYLKAHYPLQFHVNWLRLASDKIDPKQEVKELIESAKTSEIEVCVPSIDYCNEDFEIIEGRIYFGITNIKNVGKIDCAKLKSCKEKMTSWIATVLELLNINKRAAQNMIAVGVFDKFGLSRQQMLHEFSCIKGDTKLTLKEIEAINEKYDENLSLQDNLTHLNLPKKEGGILSTIKRKVAIDTIINRLDKPGRSLRDNPVQIAIMEEMLLGCAITCSKLDGCAEASHANTTCSEIKAGKRGKLVLACEIIRFKEHVDKNKNKMCFLEVEDDTGKLENIVIFASVYEECSGLIYESSTVLLFGEYKESFLVSEVMQI